MVSTLIVMFTILAMAIGVAQVSVSDLKSSSATDQSVSAYQTADSGIEDILAKVKVADPDNTIVAVFDSCSGSEATLTINEDDIAVTFYDDSDPPVQLDCTDTVDEVIFVRAVGSHGEFSRALDVAIKPSVRFASLERLNRIRSDIAEDVTGGKTIAISDINGDNFKDIIAGSSNNARRGIFWFDGADSWDETIIQNSRDAHTFTVFNIDNDNDNDIDVVGMDNLLNKGQYKVENNNPFDLVENIAPTNYVSENNISRFGENGVLFAGNKIDLYNNDGSGIFSLAPGMSCSSNCYARSIVSAKVDNDEYLDVVAGSNTGGSYIYWLKNNNGTSFSRTQIAARPTTTVEAADFTGDEKTDIVGASPGLGIWLYTNGGSANFNTGVQKTINATGEIKIADLDNDGDMDIIGLNTNSEGDLRWYKNDGSGNFSAKLIADFLAGNSEITTAVSIDVGDLDGDYDQDIVILYGTGLSFGRVGWYENLLIP